MYYQVDVNYSARRDVIDNPVPAAAMDRESHRRLLAKAIKGAVGTALRGVACYLAKWYHYATMKALTVRLNDEVATLVEQRDGELRDMSVNTLVNVAVRRMLIPNQNKAVAADDDAVAAALKRIMARDSEILEALKNI